MPAINDMVAPENDRGRRRLFKCTMESKALKIVCVSNAREHDVGNSGVLQVEVGEIFYRYGLEGAIP